MAGRENLFCDTVIATLPQFSISSPGQPILVGYKNFQVLEAQAEEIAKRYLRNHVTKYIVNKQLFASSLIIPFS